MATLSVAVTPPLPLLSPVTRAIVIAPPFVVNVNFTC
jgi:hypothetical protein